MHHKALAAHFKKAAAHHEKMADHHEKMKDAHQAHADVHNEQNDHDADDVEKGGSKSFHKKSAQFHKSMASHHEKLHKAHSMHAEHLHKMGAACTEDDAKKVAQLLEMDEGELMTKTTEQAPAAGAAPAQPTTPEPEVKKAEEAPSITIPEGFNFNDYFQKALEAKTTEAINGSIERVLSSDDFNKKVDQILAQKMLEQLGQKTVDTTIRTYPVARPGDKVIKTANGGSVGIDPTLAHLVAFE